MQPKRSDSASAYTGRTTTSRHANSRDKGVPMKYTVTAEDTKIRRYTGEIEAVSWEEAIAKANIDSVTWEFKDDLKHEFIIVKAEGQHDSA